MPQLVSQALREQRARQYRHRLALGHEWSDYDLVFPNEWGQPLEPTRVNRALKKSLGLIGIKR